MSLYFKIFSASFLIILLSPRIATSINIHVCFYYRLLQYLAYYWGWSSPFVLVDSRVCLPYLLYLFLLMLVHTYSYQCSASYCTPVSLHMLKCSCALTLTCLFIYYYFASIGHADMMWSIVSSNCWKSLHLLSVSVFNIFVAQYFVCNAWSCAATISLSVSVLGLHSLARGMRPLH
jgi:hypothetical protein